MANLIIKSSADDLVLKGSGGNSAITVGATGNTTLAGSANNIGTSTAGTLSSGVVFPDGHVLQVKNFITTGQVNMNSTSYQSTGLVCAITPASTSNKVLIIVCPNTYVAYQGSSHTPTVSYQINSSKDGVIHTRSHYSYAGNQSNGWTEISTDSSMKFLDSPATTSAVTYTINGKRDTANVNYQWMVGSTITLMEVKG